MASARPASTTRGNSSGKRSGTLAEPEISPARWAGVALVIAALLGAIVLAVVSPSVPATVGGSAAVPLDASPTPAASGPLEGPLPAGIPEITSPVDGLVIDEWDIEVSVKVPAEKIPRKDLTLVVLRGEDVIGEKPKPRLDNKVVVPGVRLVDGLNEITASLRGPGGLGPSSEPISITVDQDAPILKLTSPENKFRTFDDKVRVTGTSEPGAEIKISNKAAGFESAPLVVGPSGDFDQDVPLRTGRNQIEAVSEDAAGQRQSAKVVVVAKDGKPVIELKAPAKVDGGSLPKSINVSAVVTDVDGERMPDAEVTFNITSVGGTADTSEETTDDKGRATWKTDVVRGSRNPVYVSVSVTSPTGQTRSQKLEIKVN